jgi:hypothetical protein
MIGVIKIVLGQSLGLVGQLVTKTSAFQSKKRMRKKRLLNVHELSGVPSRLQMTVEPPTPLLDHDASSVGGWPRSGRSLTSPKMETSGSRDWDAEDGSDDQEEGSPDSDETRESRETRETRVTADTQATLVDSDHEYDHEYGHERDHAQGFEQGYEEHQEHGHEHKLGRKVKGLLGKLKLKRHGTESSDTVSLKSRFLVCGLDVWAAE